MGFFSVDNCWALQSSYNWWVLWTLNCLCSVVIFIFSTAILTLRTTFIYTDQNIGLISNRGFGFVSFYSVWFFGILFLSFLFGIWIDADIFTVSAENYRYHLFMLFAPFLHCQKQMEFCGSSFYFACSGITF